ncbi:protein-glutamine gamma-glutamyltransferase [Actinomycetes bacterium NPDC127524]
MILIEGKQTNLESLQIEGYESKSIIKKMIAYNVKYEYPSPKYLRFELFTRSNIIEASKKLNDSGAEFETFEHSMCNEKYWERLNNGGFLLKKDVPPASAIIDILINGEYYAFECSTAMAIVLYISVIMTIGRASFNKYFEGILLMDRHFDEDLELYSKKGDDFLPGDILYFKNPDFDPKQPQWRGENVIYFGNDKFFGHGIGIQSSAEIISFLNETRAKDGSESAFLTRSITRPDFISLYNLKNL